MANDDDDGTIRRFPLRRVREQEYYATVQRLDAERAAAPKLLDVALRFTPREAWATLAERPELRTSGVLERLSAMVGDEMTRDPAYALTLATLGVSLAEAIPRGEYHHVTAAQILSTAWKDYGKVLSYLARHQEALDAFSRAVDCIDALPTCTLGHDRAVIQLNRAITCQEIGRFDEGLALLAECRTIFRGYGVTQLFLLAGFYEGLLLQRLHRYREARETHLLVLAASPDIAKDTLAALHNAIGHASIELADYDAAEDNLSRAVTLYEDLRQPLEAAKGELGRGRLLIRQGLCDEGIAHLRSVRHQFLKHSLAEEAGVCGLDMVEGLLRLANFREAEALARTITNEFLAAHLSSRAITALGYLTEAIAASPKG